VAIRQKQGEQNPRALPSLKTLATKETTSSGCFCHPKLLSDSDYELLLERRVPHWSALSEQTLTPTPKQQPEKTINGVSLPKSFQPKSFGSYPPALVSASSDSTRHVGVCRTLRGGRWNGRRRDNKKSVSIVQVPGSQSRCKNTATLAKAGRTLQKVNAIKRSSEPLGELLRIMQRVTGLKLVACSFQLRKQNRRSFASRLNRTASKKINVHALHTMHALPDLPVAVGRLGEGR
jgi:hypothetical protein